MGYMEDIQFEAMLDYDREEEPDRVFKKDILYRTDKAILLKVKEGIEAWLPISQIGIGVDNVTVPVWLCIRNNID
jgi:hypothetical protein